MVRKNHLRQTHLLSDLVDEDEGAAGVVQNRRQLAKRLAHETRLPTTERDGDKT